MELLKLTVDIARFVPDYIYDIKTNVYRVNFVKFAEYGNFTLPYSAIPIIITKYGNMY
jgi:hypothetical protein